MLKPSRASILERSAKLEVAEALRDFSKTRAREAALRDRLPQAHEVRPLLRAARSASSCRCSSRSRISRQALPPSPSRCAPHRRRRPRSRCVGHCLPSFPARRFVHENPVRVPGLRREAAPTRRGRLRDARVRAGPLQGDPARAAQALLRKLPEDRAAVGAEPTDRAGPRRPWAPRARAGVQVLRSPAPVSAEPDLRPRGDRS